ncbi:MAG: hypothetical protein ABJF50_05935 [Paracoccaceae bacterium]
MAETPQKPSGPKPDSKPSVSSGEKPGAKDFQTVDLGASKGADLHVAAAAPAAMASLSGFVDPQAEVVQKPLSESDPEASTSAPLQSAPLVSDPNAQDTQSDRDAPSQETASAPAKGFSNDDAVAPTPSTTDSVASSDGGSAQMLAPELAVQRESGGFDGPTTAPVSANKGAAPEPNEPERDVESVQDSSVRVSENVEDGTVVAVFPETGQYGDVIVYTLTDANGAALSSPHFQFVGNEFRVAPGAELDFETTALFDLFVTATTPAGTSAPSQFTIEIIDVSEDISLGAGGVSFVDVGVAESSITGGDGADQIESFLLEPECVDEKP